MKRNLIEKWLISNGWEIDRWGHYHKNKITVDGETKEARLKMQESSIRYEIAIEDNEWAMITSDYYRCCRLVDNKLKINDLLVN